MPFGEDITYTNPNPSFHGGEFSDAWKFDTLADAKAFGTDLKAGTFDPFLGDAWKRIDIKQNRNEAGQFAKGFTVTGYFIRPNKGENSGGARVNNGAA